MNLFLMKALALGGLTLAAGVAGKAIAERSRWFSFRGKSVVITGGSRGLGLVLARHLVAAGARVAICARTQADLDRAAAELRQAGGEVLAFPCDVRQRDEVHGLIRQVIGEWGAVDVLINVAGVIHVGPLDAMTMDDFHHAMDTNCWGALHTVLEVLPSMRERGWGRIVNVASLGGKRSVPHMLPYDLSKHALVGLSNGLRAELAKDGIWVTTICPNLMRTGSPRNAIFKGQHRKEYAWFSLGASLPLVSLDADTAAEQILSACQKGQGEVVVAGMTNVSVWLQQLAPRLTQEVLRHVNGWLPEPGGVGRRPMRGYESESALSPSVLTTLGDQAAAANNQMHAHPMSKEY